MKCASSVFFQLGLLLLGSTSLMLAQQQPPPPPPQPPVSSVPQSGQSSGQPPSQEQQSTQEQQQATPPQQQEQQQATPPQQQEQQQATPPQQKPTEPVIATPPPRPEATPDVNLPQKEELEAELSRIQAKEEAFRIRQKDQGRLQESRSVLHEALNAKVPIPAGLLQKSKCVIVVPSLKKLAVGFGAKYGRGVMSCRLGEDFNGPWSAPAMYAIEGGNFGLQVGLQGTDLVLLVMNARGVDSLLGSKFRLGGDAALSAGPFGRNMEASTDAMMRAKILAYSRSHGIFAGVSLDGSTLRPDNKANEVLYGRQISARQILRRGDVMTPADGASFIRLLDESSGRVASDGEQGPRR